MPSASIKSRVEQILGPATQVHAVAAVRLYLSESASWEWTRVAGAVALATTNEPGRFLYVVDLTNNSVPLSQELYENFGYDQQKDFFHSFEMDDCVAGLSFADTADAKAFYQAVTARGSSRPQPQPPASRPSVPAPVQTQLPPVPQPPSNVYSQPTTPNPPTTGPPSPNLGLAKSASAPSASTSNGAGSAGKKKAGGGIFSKLKSAFASSDVPEDFAISDPRGFRHESHIGWDPEAGFEIRNIPPEWRKLFQAAGVRKNELRDAETAKFVMNVIGETMLSQGVPGTATEQHQDAPTPGGPAPPPPPPPPAGGHGGPPPPPVPGKPAPNPRPPPPARDARSDLMSSIRTGTELRKVDANDVNNINLNAMAPSDNKNLVDTLAAAMAARRNAIQEHNEEEDANEGEEEAWTD